MRVGVAFLPLGAVLFGCAAIQPSASGAPIADTVGAVLAAGGTVAAGSQLEISPRTGAPDFTEDKALSAGVYTLTGLTLLYAASAIYGFTRDPSTQESKPILGLVILTAGLAGAANGASSSRKNSRQRSSTPEGRACTNDYSCNYGSHCIKGEFKTEGICAESVDEYGTPTYSGPRPDSSGVGGPGQCSFDTDCPIGFRCEKGGGISGTCMK